MPDVCIKCVIFVEIMRDFQVTWEIFAEKMCDFRLHEGFLAETMLDFCLNGVFWKAKCVIFTSVGDFPRENA